MKKTYVLVLFISFINMAAFSQFPGKKSKNPYKALDGHSYQIGEELHLGYPSTGDKFYSVIVFKHVSGFENALNAIDNTSSALSGTYTATNGNGLTSAPKEVSNSIIKINYFKTFTLKPKNIVLTYAIGKLNNTDFDAAVCIDTALVNRELKSNNPDYAQAIKTQDAVAQNKMTVKSYNPAVNVKFLSAEGNINDQTITITLLVSHQLVHQKLQISNYLDDGKVQAYDYDGNAYSAKNVSVGLSSREVFASDKIPTGVPVKISVTLMKVLPSVKSLSYVSIPVYYNDFDGNANQTKGVIEIRNGIDIDWK